MFGFHPQDLIIVLVIALLIFGPKKLPEMGSAIGKSIKEFRKGMNEIAHPDQEPAPRKSNLTAPKEAVEETRVPFSAPGESATFAAEGATTEAPAE